VGADYRQYPFVKGRHPPGWTECTVGDVVLEMRSGYSSGKHNQTGQGIPHLRPMNVSPIGEILMQDVRYVLPNVGTLRLAQNDVLVTNTSSTIWVGKTALVTNPGDWGFSNHMTRLRIAEGVSAEFVARQLHYLCMSGYFAFHCTKHINQSSIAMRQLADDVPFRLAPSIEQNRIVTELARLLVRERRLNEALLTLRQLLQKYRSAILEAAFIGELVPTEAELARKKRSNFEPASVLLQRILQERRIKWEAQQASGIRPTGRSRGRNRRRDTYLEPAKPMDVVNIRLPKGWVWASLEQLTDPNRVICYGILMPKADVEDGVPYVKVRDMKGDAIDLSGLSRTAPKIAAQYERSSLKTGDILLSIRGTYGRVATVPRELEGGNITQDTARIAVTTSIFPNFVMWQLRSPRMQAYFQDIARGVAVKGVNIGDVRPAAVAVPPLKEQKRIVADLEKRLSVFAHIEAHVQNALQQIPQIRLSLFHRAFSGTLVDQQPADGLVTELLEHIRITKEKQTRLPRASGVRPGRLRKDFAMLALEDIKPTHLADIVKRHGEPMDAKVLWKDSQLSIDDFYAQLKTELHKTLQEFGEDRFLGVKR
jgi:type I restriction enzyme S subunit